MALELKCKLIDKLSVQNGESARGAWSKQDFVVETIETYPKKVCMNVWGSDKVADLAQYMPGDILNISINLESREYNGRWYSDIRAWRIQKDSPAQPESQHGAYMPAEDPFNGITEDSSGAEDLPF